MSIYPVPLQRWFPKRRKQDEDDRFRHDICRDIVRASRCLTCGKHCKWNRAWGHHSVPWGYGDVWCSEKCVWRKAKKLPSWRR